MLRITHEEEDCNRLNMKHTVQQNKTCSSCTQRMPDAPKPIDDPKREYVPEDVIQLKRELWRSQINPQRPHTIIDRL